MILFRLIWNASQPSTPVLLYFYTPAICISVLLYFNTAILYSCTPILLYSVLLYCCILYSCPPILLYSVLRYSYTPVICSLYLVWSPSSIEPSNSLQSVRSSSTLYASPGFQGENGFVLSWLEMLRLVCLVGGETRRTWRMQWLGGVWGVRSMCGEDWERLRVESRESGLVWSLSPLLSHHLRLL